MFAKQRFLAVCLALLMGGRVCAQELLLVAKPDKAPLLVAAASEQESGSWIGDDSGAPPTRSRPPHRAAVMRRW